MATDYLDDLAAIGRIGAIPTILEVVCRVTGLGFSAVARVTDDRWIACAVRDEIAFGLGPGGELQVESTICSEIRDSGALVAIDHVAEDPGFRDHHTPARYGFQSYISVPIRLSDGRFFGTLCAIDPRPARVNNQTTIGMFKLFAQLIAFHLDQDVRLEHAEASLAEEKQRVDLQDQFIAVLGHDLRNPLSAIQTGAAMLQTEPLPARAARVAQVIDRSARRMTGLIDNVLEFARARLGRGLSVDLRLEDDLESMLRQVVAELGTAWPNRTIHMDVAMTRPVLCDASRVGQLVSNLVANALTHGDPDGPVVIRAGSADAGFELAVTNHGPPIPAADVTRLFQPYERASDRSTREGLGLGLFIASEIARAHHGTLTVRSTTAETVFLFRIPAR